MKQTIKNLAYSLGAGSESSEVVSGRIFHDER
jgi:hypothetical protein